MLKSLSDWLTTDANGLIFTLFFCLALGYLIGKVKLGVISLGSTVGTLLVAVIVAIIIAHIPGMGGSFEISSAFRAIFFDFFIFALGYDVGPAFVQSLKSSGVKLIAMSVMFLLAAFAVGIGCKFIFNLSGGELAGLFAGALTQSTILGSAQATMTAMNLDPDTIQTMSAQLTAGYALGFLISYAGCVIFIKSFLPKLVGCSKKDSLRDEVKKTVEKMDYKGDMPKGSVFGSIRMRSFQVEADGAFVSMTIDALQKMYHEQVQVETLMRPTTDGNYDSVSLDGSTALKAGDIVTVIGDLEQMTEMDEKGMKEVSDRKFQQTVVVEDKMVVTKPMSAEALAALYQLHVLPIAATRDGKDLKDLSSFQHGDVVTLMGVQNSIQKAMKAYGYRVDDSDETDIPFMSFGVILGILVGIITIHLANVPISFGASGGIMFLGIFCGWYSDRHPQMGRVSPGAKWILKNIGLNLYVGCLGLTAGAGFIAALQQMGFTMIIAIVLMSFIPHVVAVLGGRFILKLSPVELLGGTCGCGTNTAALNGLMDQTGSRIFAAFYTPAYATSNIILTFLGIAAIAMFH